MIFIVLGLGIWLFATVIASFFGFLFALIGWGRDAKKQRWEEKYGDHGQHEVTDRLAPVNWKEDLDGWDGETDWEIEEF